MKKIVKNLIRRKIVSEPEVYTSNEDKFQYYTSEISPDYQIAGKYLFFSKDMTKLADLAKEEIKSGLFHHAKISFYRSHENSEHVLCLYYKDESKSKYLREKYSKKRSLSLPQNKFWKTDEETLAGTYSQRHLSSLSYHQKNLLKTNAIAITKNYGQSKSLNEKQKLAAEYSGTSNFVFVQAGAGCGKTKTLLGRLNFLLKSNNSKFHVVVLTFTNRAAKEIISRLNAENNRDPKPYFAGTFHGFCFKLLSYGTRFEKRKCTILPTEDQLALMSLAIKENANEQFDRKIIKASTLLKIYSRARHVLMDPIDFASKTNPIEKEKAKFYKNVFKTYELFKLTGNYLDFEDIILKCCDLIKESKDFSSWVSKYCSEILVDEIQDTNPLQIHLLDVLSSHCRIFCVGDPAQSIFGFLGANFKLIYDYKKTFIKSQEFRLNNNYRSHQQILDVSNWLLSTSEFEYANELVSANYNSGSLPLVKMYSDEREESQWITNFISKKVKGKKGYINFAILVRRMNDSSLIESEFIKSKIPYKIFGGLPLLARKHVKQVFSLLKIIVNPKDYVTWITYLTIWPKIGKTKSEKIFNIIKDLKNPKNGAIEILGEAHPGSKAIRASDEMSHSVYNCVTYVIKTLSPFIKEECENELEWKNRKRDLDHLKGFSLQFESLSDFVNTFTLDSKQNEDSDVTEDYVTISTVHSAKGMEFPVCIVKDAFKYPSIPQFSELTNEEIEEERRILYVAMTRSINELVLTNNRYQGNGFLEFIPKELVKISDTSE